MVNDDTRVSSSRSWSTLTVLIAAAISRTSDDVDSINSAAARWISIGGILWDKSSAGVNDNDGARTRNIPVFAITPDVGAHTRITRNAANDTGYACKLIYDWRLLWYNIVDNDDMGAMG